MKHLYLLIILVGLGGCSKKSEQATDATTYTADSNEVDSDSKEEVEYPDGRYCA